MEYQKLVYIKEPFELDSLLKQGYQISQISAAGIYCWVLLTLKHTPHETVQMV